MHPGIGAIDDVDVAAIIGFHIVALDRGLATLHTVDLHAALVGCLRDRWDEVADLLRLVGGANVHCTHAGIEIGDEGDFLVEHRCHAFIRGMRPETPAALAEISARFGDHEIRHHHRLCFDRDIGKRLPEPVHGSARSDRTTPFPGRLYLLVRQPDAFFSSL
jgi:hypothetical protein